MQIFVMKSQQARIPEPHLREREYKTQGRVNSLLYVYKHIKANMSKYLTYSGDTEAGIWLKYSEELLDTLESIH